MAKRDSSLYEDYILGASNQYGLDPEFMKSLIETESAWDPNAVSHAGAMGLAQLMPATAKSLGVADPFDPGWRRSPSLSPPARP